MLEFFDVDWIHDPFFKKTISEMRELGGTIFSHYILDYPWTLKQLQQLTGKCLDMGPGKGALSILLSRIPAVEMYGIDRQDLRGFWTRRGLRFTQGDFKRLPYEDQFFSCVFSVSSIEHNPDVDLPRIFREVKRVLAPRGRFVFTVPFDVKDRREGDYRVFSSAGLKDILHSVGWSLGQIHGDIIKLKDKFTRTSLWKKTFLAGGVVTEKPLIFGGSILPTESGKNG